MHASADADAFLFLLDAEIVSTSLLYVDCMWILLSAEVRHSCILQGPAGQGPGVRNRQGVLLFGNKTCMVGSMFVWCGVLRLAVRTAPSKSEGLTSFNCEAEVRTSIAGCADCSRKCAIIMIVVAKLLLQELYTRTGGP